MIKHVSVTLKGTSSLLMHKYPMVPIEALEKQSAESQAEHCAYRDADGQLIVPSVCVQRALVSAATYSKGKGRSSLQKSAAACLQIRPEEIPLGKSKYVIDSRPVVIKATGGRILRHRPKIDNWEITFELEYDDTLLSEIQLRRIVDDMGTRVGLLDFRPERKGPFGRSVVTNWEPIEI